MTEQNSMPRREMLKAIGAGAIAASAGGCAPMPATTKHYARPYSRQPFAFPRVSMDAVIRVIVGHRPYRPKGFVVKKEQIDTKTVVHNYGHGGAGLSLSWGSSGLAVRLTRGMTPGKVAVLGSGVMGLTSARLLQDEGWDVTIYTRDVWRHTTSNVAAGEWSTYSAQDPAVSSDAFKSQLARAASFAHHAFTNLTGPDYGIRWLEGYTLSDTPFESTFPGTEEEAKLHPYKGNLGPGEHPFPTAHAQHMVSMQIDPSVLLRRLVQDVQLAGGKFVIRNFKNLSDVLSLQEGVIFNCTGLGARTLFGDEDLTAAKGQLVFVPPDPAVDYFTFGGGRDNLHMFPRSDVVVLGAIFKPEDFSRQVEPDETERIVTEHERIFSQSG